MGHKVHPFSFRLGVTEDWKSKWCNSKNYQEYLKQDIGLRRFLEKKLAKASIENVIIERSANLLTVNIFSGRPGMIIGRGGTGADELKNEIKDKVNKKNADNNLEVRVNIQEVKHPEISAKLVAQSIAEQIEKRTPFRRTLKKAIERVIQNREVKGVKVSLSGRLNGAEMSRREWLSEGKIPLQTLRSNVDFAQVNAHTTFGVIGVKVWIYKGEVFD